MVPLVPASIAPPTILTCRYARRMSGLSGVAYASTDHGAHLPQPIRNSGVFLFP